MKKEYYFIDVNLVSMKVVNWGMTPNATLSGNTNNPKIHRAFLTKGQYKKLLNKLS
jgi:hypothetical protein